MPVTNTPIFPQALLSKATAFVNATGTTVTQILAAQTNGAKVEDVLITSTDTSARDVTLYLTIGGTSYPIGTISIPITAGSIDTVVGVNLLTALINSSPAIPLPVDERGNPYLYLDSSTSLSLSMGTAVTAAKQVTVVVLGGAF